jgi:excisionase family DNA binding protein
MDFSRLNNLLTVDQVAERLKINRSTVYKYKKELGGFYLFGNRALRFTEEGINGYLERQGAGRLDLHFSIQGRDLRRPRLQDESLSPDSPGGKTQGDQRGGPSKIIRKRFRERVDQILGAQ